MRFTKMHGAGNDFIIINNLEERIAEEDIPALAKRLCARRTGIGADGIMLTVSPLSSGDFRLLFYNSDGSKGEMCGNGARCIARYGYEHGLAGEIQRIETTAGLVIGERISETMYRVRLNDPSVIDLHRKVIIDGITYDCAYVELGNPGIPHAVVQWPDLETAQLRELGRKLRFAPEFPKGANINFVKPDGKDSIKAITYERGVEDFTLACGTGSGSITTVITLMGKVSGKDVKIQMPGGDLFVSVTAEPCGHAHDIFLTGPTCVVCEGEIKEL